MSSASRVSRWRLVATVVVLVGTTTVLSGVTLTGAGAVTKAGGSVDVLYAGSLVGMMEQGIGPAFDARSGYTFNGFSGGSKALASDISGKTQVADVFVSASPAVDASLKGRRNGNWVSWYATFAHSPLVLGYNPASPFASQLASKPWYQVVIEPGFILGRTDPSTDPKGALIVQALKRAARQHRAPALGALARSTAGIYAEQTLVGLLQAGQIDAGFFYAAEASAADISTIPLGLKGLRATFTVTVLNRAPHAKAAAAFVKFLFSPLGRSILKHDGLSVVNHRHLVGSLPRKLKGVFADR